MKVLRSPRSVMVTKLVMTTSSLGIIISERNAVKSRSLPGKSRRENANAASTMTTSMSAVVTAVKMTVFMK